jgi:6-phosphogluconolactonase (cycloisomerase 2 family)
LHYSSLRFHCGWLPVVEVPDPVIRQRRIRVHHKPKRDGIGIQSRLGDRSLKEVDRVPIRDRRKRFDAGTVDLFNLFLFVTNQGSGDLSVFQILSNGGLKLVSGAPFFSGLGARSAIVTADARFLFVANALADSISAFSVNVNNGALTPLATSPFSTGAGSAPSSLALDPIGNFLYVANTGTNNVLALRIAEDDSLSLVNGSPFSSGASPSAIGINPFATFLYTANFGNHNVSAFFIDAENGALTPVSGSPFPAGSGPSATAIDPSGLFLYLANTNDNTVSGYDIDAKVGSLSPVSGSPFGAGLSPSGAVVDKAGKFLQALENRAVWTGGIGMKWAPWRYTECREAVSF